MKQIKHLIHFILTLCLCTLCMVPAFAKENIDDSALGNIFLTLYQKSEETGTPTGLEKDDPKGEPIEGMEFTLYPVKNSLDTIAYYDGKSSETITVSDFLKDEEMDETKIINDSGYEVQSGITDVDGKISFKNLPVGMYVLLQTNIPFNVLEKAPASLISIPFSVENQWCYDAYVYPKSEVNLQDQLEIIKYGNGFENQQGSVLLEGVTFSLLKKGEKEDWSDAVEMTEQNLVTDKEGTIVLNGLKNGEYRLQEQSVGKDKAYILESAVYDFKVERGKVIFEEDFENQHTYTVDGKEEPYVRIDDNKLSIINCKPIVEKKVENDQQAFTVGSRVKYNVDTLIPLNVSQLETLVFIDTPKHIEFDELLGVTISVNESGEIIPEEYYQLEKNQETKGFRLRLVNPVSSSNFLVDWNKYAGKVITISYYGILLPEAVLNPNDNSNKITLLYSGMTKIEGAEIKESDDDEHTEVVVHTFELEVTKNLKGLKEGKSKKGVTFQLYKGESTAKEDRITFTQDNGKYVIDPNGTVNKIITNENGKIYIAGLGNGKFTLKETKTIHGYNLLKEPVVITIDIQVHEDGSKEPNSKDSLKFEGDRLQLEIINKKGIELPNTKGLTLIFLSLLGIVLLFAGFTYLNLHHKGE